MSARRCALVLALLAPTHAACAVQQGATEGDYGLLWFALPFVVLTLAAAGLVLLARPVAWGCAVALTVVSLLLAVAAVPVYLLGLFQLPQAVAALVVALRGGPPH